MSVSVVNATRLANDVLDEVEKAVVGQRRALEPGLTAVLANLHVLIEDVPGLGKTLPDPFVVVATQNSIEYEGTYPLRRPGPGCSSQPPGWRWWPVSPAAYERSSCSRG